MSGQVRQYRTGHAIIAATMAIIGTFSGCAVFSPEKDALTDYEATKRSINDPVGQYGNGVYRPEGVSAEKAEGNTILHTIGLAKKPRRDKDLADSKYAEAEKMFEAAKPLQGEERIEAFRAAAEMYLAAAKDFRYSTLEQDAVLMAAESRFFAEDYYQSEQLYARLVKEYPRNPYLDHVDARRFEIADFWLKLDATEGKPFYVPNFFDPKEPWNDTGGHGERVLDKLRIENPTGKISDDATMRIAMEQYENGEFEEAAHTFADLRMTYPDSEHLFNSQFLEIQALLASYQGAQYSSIPLTDAQKRVKQIARQFPVEAQEKQAELNEAYSKIRFLLAERVWNIASYRRARQENGSAKFHYRRLIEEYPSTPFAEQAQAELEKLADAPDDPPQRFKSLVWLFGADAEERPWLK